MWLARVRFLFRGTDVTDIFGPKFWVPDDLWSLWGRLFLVQRENGQFSLPVAFAGGNRGGAAI